MKSQLALTLHMIAQGEAFSASALHEAANHPACTSNDAQMLRRYWNGLQAGTDHVRLQSLANEIERLTIERN